MTDPAEPGEPTPAEPRELMAEADALQERIKGIEARLRTSEETRHIAFRLDHAAGYVGQASSTSNAGKLRLPAVCQVAAGD